LVPIRLRSADESLILATATGRCPQPDAVACAMGHAAAGTALARRGPPALGLASTFGGCGESARTERRDRISCPPGQGAAPDGRQQAPTRRDRVHEASAAFAASLKEQQFAAIRANYGKDTLP